MAIAENIHLGVISEEDIVIASIVDDSVDDVLLIL